MIGTALARWVQVLHNHPVLSWIAVLAISVGAGFGLTRFEIDPDVSALLPSGSEEVELYRATNLGEDAPRTLYLLIRGERLEERLGGLLENLRQSPYLTEVTGTRAEFGGEFAQRAQQAPLWFLPDSALDDLLTRLAPEGRRAAVQESKELLVADPLMGREVVKHDPLGLRWIFSSASQDSLPASFDRDSAYLTLDAGRAAFVRVRGREVAFNVEFSENLLIDVEARCEGFEMLAVGGYSIAREDSRRIRGDLMSSLAWSLPLLLLFFLLSTRSFVLPHLYLIPTGLAVFWTMGYGGLLLGPMTPLAVSAAAILCGLGVDFSIHYLGRFREEQRDKDLLGALQATQHATARSLLGCWLTSSVAFLSFAFGSFSGLRSLGLLLALGLTLTLFSTWTILPLLLRSVPRLPQPRPPGRLLNGFARLARTPWAPVLSVTLIVLAGAGWTSAGLKGVAVDADPSHLRPAHSEVARNLTQLEETLGFAPEGVTLLLNQAHSPMRFIEAERALRASGRVAFSNSSSQVPNTPERAERVAQFRAQTTDWVAGTVEDLRAAGLRPDSLRPALESLDALFRADLDGPAGPLPVHLGDEQYWSATFHPPASFRTRDERDQFRNDLQAAVDAPTRAMDPGALGDAIGPLLAVELQRAMGGCALIVALVILLSVGRVRPGLIAMLPVLCGLGVVLGAFEIFGWVIHPGNLLALPLLIGLGVDDGLYMVNRSLEDGADPIMTTGVDVWRTSVTTAVGFGSLMTAQSPAIASLGGIVLIGTVTCFFATVVLIPWLLRSRTHA